MYKHKNCDEDNGANMWWLSFGGWDANKRRARSQLVGQPGFIRFDAPPLLSQSLASQTMELMMESELLASEPWGEVRR